MLGTLVVCVLCLAGSVGLAGLLARREPPEQEPTAPRAGVGVRVHEVAARDIRPRVTALGRVRPLRVAEIAARVYGTVQQLHPRLEAGEVLSPELVAVQLDPRDQDLEVTRLRAQLDGARAEMERLQAQETYLADRLEVLEELVRLEEVEDERARSMLERGVGSERESETARLGLLARRDTLLSLRTTRDLMRPQIAAAQAHVREVQAQLDLALLQVDRTTIKAPFAGLVGRVEVEVGEEVAAGEVLFELWQVDRVEVPAVISLEEATLLAPALELPVANGGATPVTAEVRYQGPGLDLTWPQARLVRLEPVDPTSQTLRAVVEVEQEPGKPVLLPGVLCQVTLHAPPRQVITVPLEGLQERSQVYAVRADRLVVLPVVLGLRMDGLVEVREGLEPGELVIVSPLEKAYAGLPVMVLGQTSGDG